MPTDRPNQAAALARLEALVGVWSEEPGYPDAPAGRTVIEWALDGQFVIERSEIPHPDFPDSLSLIAIGADRDTYTKHYFDSRGVVRLYQMTLTDRTWTLVRDMPDFTPLDFSQRFVATIADDGRTISGAWETFRDGGYWEKDFDLVYRKVG